MNKSFFPPSADRPGGNGAFPSREQAIAPNAQQGGSPSSLALTPGDYRADMGAHVSYGGGRYGQEDNGGFDLTTVLGILRRRWKLMLIVFAVIFLFHLISLKRSHPIYRATSTLEILQQNQSSASDAEIPGLETYSGHETQMQTHIQLIGGGMIRDGALRRLNAEEKEKLAPYSTVNVKAVEGSNLLTIEVEAYDAQVASSLANAIAQEYVDSTLAKNQANSTGAVVYIQNQLKDVRTRLIDAQTQLRKFKQKSGVFSVEGQAALLSTRVGQIRTALETAQVERTGALAEAANAQRLLSNIPSRRLVATGVTKNGRVDDLQMQLADLQSQRKVLILDYTEGSERIRAIDTQINSLKKQLAAQPKTVVQNWVPDPLLVPLKDQITTAQTKADSLNATIQELSKQLASARKDASALPDQEFRFVQLSTDSQAFLQTYQLLNDKLQSLRIGAKVRQSDARLVAAASDGNQVAPEPRKIIATGFVLGILASIALALAWDVLDNRIYSEDDAQRATSLPVLAQIPFEKQAEQQILLNAGHRITPLLESFRMLRANIAFSAADRPLKAIVVTSSVPNEGKSSSALNLAAATALGGENVVLIDLDLRRPSQHLLAGVPASPGFTNVVSGQAELEDVLQETSIPSLKLLTSGPVPPNPFKLLNSQSARQIIMDVIERADFVVIDTPPILGLADARLISTLVDATLLVVSSQETGRREAARAAELLTTTTHDALGIVLTKVPGGLGGYGSYATYRSYARYFDDDQRSVELMEDPDLPKKSLGENTKKSSV